MKTQSLLDGLGRLFQTPTYVPESFFAVGAKDLRDVAVIEYFLFFRESDPKAIAEWVACWPMSLRCKKPKLLAAEVPAWLVDMEKRGLLLRKPGEHELTTKVLQQLFVPASGRTDVVINIHTAKQNIRRVTPVEAPVLALRLLAELGEEGPAERFERELGLLSESALVLCASLLVAWHSDDEAWAAIKQACRVGRAELTHPMDAAAPANLSLAHMASLFFATFAANVFPRFNLEWLADAPQRNVLRIEWLLRAHLFYMGASVRSDTSSKGLGETPLDSARKLLSLDHERAQRLAEEAGWQASSLQQAKALVKAESERRELAAKAAAEAAALAASDSSYMGGRRE